MRKRKNIFKPFIDEETKNDQIPTGRNTASEKWIFGILPADKEAPNVEDEKSSAKFIPFLVIFVIALVTFWGRAFYLQVIKGSENLILAQENRFRVQKIKAPRGFFYDRNKKVLVKNIANYEINVIPNDLPRELEKRENVYKEIADIIGVSADKIKKEAEKKGLNYIQPITIAQSINRDQSLIFESKRYALNGFYLDINPIREYLDNGLLSHAFGYVGKISEEELEKNPDYDLTSNIGKSGLEKEYEKILKGVDGKERVEISSDGEIVRVYGREEPILGDNIMLSIDFELQKKLAAELEKQMKRAKVEKGAAIAVNPQNGEVLASVSLPTYNNNLFSKGISEDDYSKLLNDKNSPLLNRVISGEYPSGSTIKPYLAAAALEEGTINENTTVLSTGGIKIGEWEFPDWKSGGHGVTNVIKAIAESVNTFFYAISGGYKNIKGLGPKLMKQYLEKFGFGNFVNIDIDGEAKGHLPSPEWKEEVKKEPWYLGDTYHFGIGQGDVLVTPLQMVNALSVIANGGTMYKIHFLKAILDTDGNIKEKKNPEIVKKDFISNDTIDIVRRGMRQTVISGSARSMSSLPVSSAGKTGTAQFGPNNSKKHAWFTCFAPYEKPEIAMVILLEGAGEGSDYAVPVARETLRWYFSR